MELHLQLLGVTCHMRSHSFTCHRTRLNICGFNPRQTGRYSIYVCRRGGILLCWPAERGAAF